MEKMVDVELNLGKELAGKIRKMTKNDLINIIVSESIRNRTQDKMIVQLEKEKLALSTKLDKAESYVEQGRAMIESVMERWYHYDA